uniref:Uncharacterized protein n=1 Tax=Avena sativa TaxID=4498 RepID=A0ACD6A122_AVESA
MERQPAVAAAEDAIALYDTCWFHRLVLHSYSSPPAPLPTPPPPPEREQQQPEQAPAESKRELERAPTGLRHRRTRSDEAKTATFDALEPLKIPNSNRRARLETILSGKDGLAAPQPQPLPERRRPEKRWPGGRRRKARGRSLSELEFEEVKGLQDLGFTFSEADVDAELASIVPGLRRLRAEEETKKADEAAVAAASAEEEEACRNRATSAPAPRRRRPYLSEAWEDEEAEVRRMLSTFRIPAADDGADLKEHLRLWAHSVASAVR